MVNVHPLDHAVTAYDAGRVRLGLYTRISRDPDGTSEAPGRQESACRAWAERNGHEIVKLYTDRDISGYKDVQRPAFNSLLQARDIDGIICWRIDRLLRNWRDWAKLDTLLDNGLVLFTEDGTDSRRDAVSLAIKVTFAKEESRKISERVTAQREASARNGAAPSGGHRAFGYTRDKEIVQDEANEIRAAVKSILSGGSLSAITRDWNTRGVQTTTGGRWHSSVLRLMLGRPLLAGFRQYKQDIYPAQWEPIISEIEHKAIQRVFLGRSHQSVPKKHWLSGLLHCGVCGHVLQANREQYKCVGCGGCSVLIRFAVRAAEARLVRRAKRVTVQATETDYSGEVAAKEQAIQKWDDEFAYGTMDRFTYRRLRERLTSDLAELHRKQDSANYQIPADFETWWPERSILDKASDARKMIKKITVRPPGRGRRTYDASLFAFEWRSA